MPQPDAQRNLPAASLAMREFVKSLRPDGPGDLSELRALMRVGWLEHLPDIQDEYGVLLVGNRRLLVAQELGIEPNIKTVTFGDGEEADAERRKLAIASNMGGEGLSKEARKSAAEHLYGTGKNTMKQIADALSVSFTIIQRDLKEFIQVDKFQPHRRGRPKGTVTHHDPVERASPHPSEPRSLRPSEPPMTSLPSAKNHVLEIMRACSTR